MFQRPRLFTPKERAKLANSEGAVAKLSLAQPSSLSPHDAPSELLVFATPTNLFGLLVVLAMLGPSADQKAPTKDDSGLCFLV